MSVATQLKTYLARRHIRYDVITHAKTTTASATAEAAHIEGDRMLKAVVFHCDDGYMLTVMPSTHRVEMEKLSGLVDKPLDFASEAEITKLFGDCELGAVPAAGDAYGVSVMLDDALLDADDVYFEAGDHESLIHLDANAFRHLMANAEHGRFSYRA
jgi:Ala-tRNA(Pro) deacylase